MSPTSTLATCLTLAFGLTGSAAVAQTAAPTPPANPTAGAATMASPTKTGTPVVGATLAKIRAQGYVQCGSASRPGLAETNARGDWSGLEVEICHAVAVAVLGDEARYAYHRYESAKDYDSVRAGADQLSFLTFAEMTQQGIVDKVAPGPTVFAESHDLMVAVDSPVRHPADLAGQGICFIIGTAQDNSLEAWFRERDIDIVPNAYQEDGELHDTFQVQRCKAEVGESTELAAARLDKGVNNLSSRLLPDHLLVFPIVAATPVTGDAQWTAIVAWTIDTLLNADARETNYRASGLRAMAVEGPDLGLAPGWQKAVVDRVGSYSAIFKRTLGADSPLKLEPGLNQTVAEGGILLPPFRN